MHRSEGFPCKGLFRPCVRLVREVDRFGVLFACWHVHLLVSVGEIGVWLNRTVDCQDLFVSLS